MVRQKCSGIRRSYLDIAPDEIKNKTIGEIEKLAIQALRSA